jgi:hypothetical protein
MKTASAAALLADDVADGDAPGVLVPPLLVVVVRGATAAASSAL